MRRTMSGSGRVLVIGGLLLLAALILFVAFVTVAIASDNSADVPMLLLFGGSFLAGLTGCVLLVVGLVVRVSGARQRAAAHDAALIAQMGRASTSQHAATVQAHGTSRRWMQFLPLISIATLLAVLVLPFPTAVKVAAFLAVLGGFVVVFLLPRRRTATVVAGDWNPPGAAGLRRGRPTGDLPGPARERMQDRSLGAQGRRMWACHHPTLLAREESVAALARRRGWDFRHSDPAMTAGRHVVLNVVRGAQDGVPFTAFDDVGTTETSVNGQVSTVTLQPVTSVVVPFAAPFRLAVVQDWIGTEVHWGHFGHQVQLESGAFNDAHNVYCVDPVRARLVLNPAIMARLLDNPGLELVLEKGLLRLDRHGGFAAESTLEAMVDLAYRVHRSASAAQVRPR